MFRIAALFCIVLASPALAQEGMYVGLGAGSFDYSTPTGFPFIGTIDETGSNYKLYGGFEFNENFGAEVSFGKTSGIESLRRGNQAPFGEFTGTSDLEFTATTLKATAMLPRDWGTLIGGLGFFSLDGDLSLGLTAACCGSTSTELSYTDDGLMATLGIEWRFGRFNTGIGVRLEYEWWDVSDADASMLGLGLAYRF